MIWEADEEAHARLSLAPREAEEVVGGAVLKPLQAGVVGEAVAVLSVRNSRKGPLKPLPWRLSGQLRRRTPLLE